MTELRTTIKGFTLIELMITLAIAAILLGLAAPSFNDLIKDNRLTTQINALSASLNLARSESIKRSLTVTVCKSTGGTQCGGEWSDGWIVFEDSDGTDGNVDANDTIIRVNSALTIGNTLNFNNGNYVKYSSTGFGSIAGTFTLCDDRDSANKYAKALIISPSGRTRVATDNDGDGIVEGGNGEKVECPS
jgi:type IV fimbrial biogenesis protein FimT